MAAQYDFGESKLQRHIDLRNATGRSWACGKRVPNQLCSTTQDDVVVCQPKASELELYRVAGLNIGALLAKEGLAMAQDDYQELGWRARSAHVGLWE